jgi:hypothetical protein
MTGVDTNLSIDSRRDFLQALRRILRPIVRLMIRSGIRYDEFVDVARGAYVESAIRDVDKDAPRPTRDQVAWTTGIQRDLVDHYIESNESHSTQDTTSKHVETDLLHKWYTDPRYLGPTGAPIELAFDTPGGPSLKDLLAQIDARVDADSILEKLLRARSVTRLDNGLLRALSRFFIWPEEDAVRHDSMGCTVAHMIETHEHNLCFGDPENRRLERTVSTDRGISEQLLPSFHAFARERAEQFLIDLDDWFGQHSSSSGHQTAQRVEIGVNVFFYVEPPLDVGPLTTLVQPRRTTPNVNAGAR